MIAYHFQQTTSVPKDLIPVTYAIAIGSSGTGSLIFGRIFDRFGILILVPLTVLAALFAPLVFLGGFWPALLGLVPWGLGMGVHESIIRAAVAPMLPAQLRASAYGLLTAGYGMFWFIGSALIGFLYDRSISAVVAFCVVCELAAIPCFILVRRQTVARGRRT